VRQEVELRRTRSRGAWRSGRAPGSCWDARGRASVPSTSGRSRSPHRGSRAGRHCAGPAHGSPASAMPAGLRYGPVAAGPRSPGIRVAGMPFRSRPLDCERRGGPGDHSVVPPSDSDAWASSSSLTRGNGRLALGLPDGQRRASCEVDRARDASARR
jgi:hypothetical protein